MQFKSGSRLKQTLLIVIELRLRTRYQNKQRRFQRKQVVIRLPVRNRSCRLLARSTITRYLKFRPEFRRLLVLKFSDVLDIITVGIYLIIMYDIIGCSLLALVLYYNTLNAGFAYDDS